MSNPKPGDLDYVNLSIPAANEFKAKRRLCPCGSGKIPNARYDGHGIFLCYTCEICHRRKMKGFRSDIHTCYECDEPIEED